MVVKKQKYRGGGTKHARTHTTNNFEAARGSSLAPRSSLHREVLKPPLLPPYLTRSRRAARERDLGKEDGRSCARRHELAELENVHRGVLQAALLLQWRSPLPRRALRRSPNTFSVGGKGTGGDDTDLQQPGVVCYYSNDPHFFLLSFFPSWTARRMREVSTVGLDSKGFWDPSRIRDF